MLTEKNVIVGSGLRGAKLIQVIPYFISGIAAIWLSALVLTSLCGNNYVQNEMSNNENTTYSIDNSKVPQGIDENVNNPKASLPENLPYESTIRSFASGISLPLREFHQTDVFGGRTNPLTNKWEGHNGVDLDAGWKANVLAIAEGEVCAINRNPSTLGNWIMIRHRRGNEIMYSIYGHLHSVAVSINEQVQIGQIVGTQGGDPELDTNPGQSTGSHLHLEVRLMEAADTAIDPAFLLPLQ